MNINDGPTVKIIASPDPYTIREVDGFDRYWLIILINSKENLNMWLPQFYTSSQNILLIIASTLYKDKIPLSLCNK